MIQQNQAFVQSLIFVLYVSHPRRYRMYGNDLFLRYVERAVQQYTLKSETQTKGHKGGNGK